MLGAYLKILFLILGLTASAQKDDINYDYFRLVVRKIKQEYVRPVEGPEIFKGAIQGILSKLDSYSQYLTKDEYEEFLQEVDGHYYGIGVEIKNVDNKIVVVSPLENSPAIRAGLRPGDVIISVDGEKVSGGSIMEAVNKIRGPLGTTVTLEILREGQEDGLEPLKIPVTREEIKLNPIKFALLEDGILYVRISKFLSGVTKSFREQLKNYRKKDLKGIIIDVRLNPGGLLKEVLTTTDLFLPGGLILETRSRHRDQQKKYFATDRVAVKQLPCVILIDRGSASASEILAGALKDNGYCTVIGERSFGKGSVQTSFNLPNGDALILTTAHYYTKSGVKIEENGIEPTFVVKNPELKYAFTQSDWQSNPGKLLTFGDVVLEAGVRKVKEMLGYMDLDSEQPVIDEN